MPLQTLCAETFIYSVTSAWHRTPFAAVSRTIPTLFVLVIITGPCRKPESSTQCVPVSSPLPFRSARPAKTALALCPRGRIQVTPVRAKSLSGSVSTEDSPSITVQNPTSTPATSVIAFHFPLFPSNGKPSSRAFIPIQKTPFLFHSSQPASHYIHLSIPDYTLVAPLDAAVRLYFTSIVPIARTAGHFRLLHFDAEISSS